ncbi:unnamed protein product, partial [Phaeothamnion confervicola]
MNNMKKVALNIIARNLHEDDIGHLRKIFQSIDLDGNGVITAEEFQQVVASEGMLEMQKEVFELMKGIDMDGNQMLDYNEFLAATLEKAVFLRSAYLRTAFDHFDTNSKGFINVDDL